MPLTLPIRLVWLNRFHWPGTPLFWVNAAAVVLMISTLVAFFSALIQFAANVPVTDDYHATLQFLLNYTTQPHNRFGLLFSQHNEHRIVVSRLLALLQYTLTGEVNFRQLLLLQSLFLVALLLAITRFFHQSHVRLNVRRTLPIILLLFSLNTWETYLFMSGSSQSYPALLGMVCALLCLHQAYLQPGIRAAGWGVAGALAATLATFSFGCGMLIWPTGLLLLLLRKQWYAGLAWGGVGAAVLLLYLSSYHSASLSQNVLTEWWRYSAVFGRFALSFPATSFQIPWDDPLLWRCNQVLYYTIGLAAWAYFGYLTVSGYARRQPLVYTFIALFFAVDLLIAFSRCQIGSNTAFNSRYQILSAMLLIGLYLAVLERGGRWALHGLRVLSLVLFLVAGLSAIYQPQRLADQYTQKMGGLQSWLRTGSPTLFVPTDLQPGASDILKQTGRAGIYRPQPDLTCYALPVNADTTRRYVSPSAPVHPASRR